MAWTIELTDDALKQLQKMGKPNARRIRDYLRNRIGTLDDPRSLGKALRGSASGSFWRYRMGDYRILCDLQDRRLVVLMVEIVHRSEIYR